MAIPYIKEIPKYKSEVNVFDGYDHRPRIGDGSFYDLLNVTCDKYPFISTRKSRATYVSNLGAIQAMDGADGDLFVVTVSVDKSFWGNNKYYLNIKWGFLEQAKEISESDYGKARNIVRMGNRYCIFPDALLITRNDENIIIEDMTATETSKNFSLEAGFIITETVDDVTVEKRFSPLDRYYYDITKVGLPDYNIYPGIFDVGDRENVDDRIYIRIVDKNLDLMLKKDSTLASRLKEVIVARLDAVPWVPYDERDLNEKYYDIDSIRMLEDGSVVFKGSMFAYSVTVKDGTQMTLAESDGNHGIVDNTVTVPSGLSITYDKAFLPPLLDYVVECQNRLWGCRSGLNRQGVEVNELYATALGDPSAWFRFEGIADDSWTASVGTAGKFTAATVVSDCPIFFKENVMHKIYPSAKGAHQVIQSTLNGVGEYNSGSVAQVGDYVYYQGRDHFYAFDGTNTTVISDRIDMAKFTGYTAGAYKDKYVCYAYNDDYAKHYFLVYDTRKGIWTVESVPSRVSYMTQLDDYLLYTQGGTVKVYCIEGDNEANIPFMLETGEIGYDSTDGKYLCRLDLRVTLEFGAHFNVWIQYDNDERWLDVARIVGTAPKAKVQTLNIMPRRCDLFKIKCTGVGNMTLHNMRRIYEVVEA